MKPVWHWKDYLLARQRFVQTGERRASASGVALVFTATWLAGWACSALLLRFGHMRSMGLRYALSAMVAYAVFFAAVRLWAGVQTKERPGMEMDVSGIGSWSTDEGCLIVLAVFLASLLAAVLLSMFGGLTALLEVAFEVAFAGVVVRRAFGQALVVGPWWQTLLRRTVLPALLVGTLLVALAALVQARDPQALTLGQAIEHWLHAQPK